MVSKIGQEKTVKLDLETAEIINKKAEAEGTTPQEALSEIIRNRLDELEEADKIREITSAISAVEVVEEKIQSVKSIAEATKLIDKDLETARETLKDLRISQKINLNADFYETVTVKVPRAVMNLLRASESITGDSPRADIEYAIVESVRARIDGGQFLPTREVLVKQYNLNPIFKAVLDCPVE